MTPLAHGGTMLVSGYILSIMWLASAAGKLTCLRSCRQPRRTTGGDGRDSPRSSPSSRGRWPMDRNYVSFGLAIPKSFQA